MRAAPARIDWTSVTPERAAPTVVEVLGVPFASVSFADAAVLIRGLLASGEGRRVVLANAHTLNLAWESHAYRETLRRADLVLRDGIGVEIASMLAGRRLAHNFVGTDFVPRLLAALGDLEPRVFLYGAAPGVAERAAETLAGRCPRVRIVGVADGYGARDVVALRIAQLRPDVLLVALGNPLQEQWIEANLERVHARVAIGVGALFDYLAGRVRRAPRWVLALRSEWLFRLLTEPRRLARRYLIGNVQFLWRVARSAVR